LEHLVCFVLAMILAFWPWFGVYLEDLTFK